MHERLEEGRKPWNFGRKVFNWKPELHPRDRKGRFINVFKKILNLEVGQHYDLNKVVKDAPNIQQGTVWRNRQGWEVRTQTRQGIWGTQINNRDLLDNEDIFDDFLMVVNEGEHFPDAPLCPCGCGNKSASGGLLPGHDARARGRLQAKALKGDQQALKAALAIPEPASLKPDNAPKLMSPDVPNPDVPDPNPDAELPGSERFDALGGRKLIKDRWFEAFMWEALYDFRDSNGDETPDWEEIVRGDVQDWEVGQDLYDRAHEAYRDAERIWDIIGAGGMPEENLRYMGYNIRKMGWMVQELWDDGKFLDEDQEQAMANEIYQMGKAADARIHKMREAQDILGINKYDHRIEDMDTFEYQTFLALMMQLTEQDFIDRRKDPKNNYGSKAEYAKRFNDDFGIKDPDQDVLDKKEEIENEMRDELGQAPPPSPLFDIHGNEDDFIHWLLDQLDQARSDGVDDPEKDLEAIYIADAIKDAFRAPQRKRGEPPEPRFKKESRQEKRRKLDEWAAKHGITRDLDMYEQHMRIMDALEDDDYPPGITPAFERLEEYNRRRAEEARKRRERQKEIEKMGKRFTSTVDEPGAAAAKAVDEVISAERRQGILDKWPRQFLPDVVPPGLGADEPDGPDPAVLRFDEEMNKALNIIEDALPGETISVMEAREHLKKAQEVWPDIKDKDVREDATHRYKVAKILLDGLDRPADDGADLPNEWQRISARGDDRRYGFEYRYREFTDETKAGIDERNKERLDIGRALGFDMETASDEEILDGVTQFIAGLWNDKFEGMNTFDQRLLAIYLGKLGVIPNKDYDNEPLVHLSVRKEVGNITSKKIADKIALTEHGVEAWTWMTYLRPEDILHEEMHQASRRKDILDKYDRLWSPDPGVVDGRKYKDLPQRERMQFLDDLRYMTLKELPRNLALPYGHNYDPIMGRRKAKMPDITPDVPDKPVSEMTVDEIKEATERLYREIAMQDSRRRGEEDGEISTELIQQRADAIRHMPGTGPSRTGIEKEVKPEDREIYEIAAYFKQADEILKYFEQKGEPVGGMEFISSRHVAEYHAHYMAQEFALKFKHADKYGDGYFHGPSHEKRIEILKERGLRPEDLFDPDELKDPDLFPVVAQPDLFWAEWAKRATAKLTDQMMAGDVLDPDDYPELEHTGWPYTGTFASHMNMRGLNTWWSDFQEWRKLDPDIAAKLEADRTRYLLEVRRQMMEETHLGIWSDKVRDIKEGKHHELFEYAYLDSAMKWFQERAERAEIDAEITGAFWGFLYDLTRLEGVNAPGNRRVMIEHVQDMRRLVNEIKEATRAGDLDRVDRAENELSKLLADLREPNRERDRDYPFLDSGFGQYARRDRALYSPAYDDDLKGAEELDADKAFRDFDYDGSVSRREAAERDAESRRRRDDRRADEGELPGEPYSTPNRVFRDRDGKLRVNPYRYRPYDKPIPSRKTEEKDEPKPEPKPRPNLDPPPYESPVYEDDLDDNGGPDELDAEGAFMDDDFDGSRSKAERRELRAEKERYAADREADEDELAGEPYASSHKKAPGYTRAGPRFDIHGRPSPYRPVEPAYRHLVDDDPDTGEARLASVGPSMTGPPRYEVMQGPLGENGLPIRLPEDVQDVRVTGDLMTNVNFGPPNRFGEPNANRTYGTNKIAKRKRDAVTRMIQDARRYGEKLNLRKVLSEVVPFVNDRKCSCGCGGTVPFQRGRKPNTGTIRDDKYNFLPGHKERADIAMFEAATRGDFKAISDIRSDPALARQWKAWAAKRYAGSPDPSVPDLDKNYSPEELAFSPERVPDGIPLDSEYAPLLDPGPGEKHIQVQRLTVRRDRAVGSTERGLLNETLRRLRWGVGRRDDETVGEYERRMNDIGRDTPDLYGNDDGPLEVVDYPSAEQQEQDLREDLDLTPMYVPMRGTSLEGGGYRVVNIIRDPHYQREEGDGIAGEAKLLDDLSEAERIEEVLRDMGAFVGPSSYSYTGKEVDPQMRQENDDVTQYGRAITLSVWIPIGDGKYVEYFPEVTDHDRLRGRERYRAGAEHLDADYWGSIDRAPEFDSPDGLTPDMQAEGFHANPYSLRGRLQFEGMSPREIDDFLAKLFPNSRRERQAVPRLTHHGDSLAGRPFVYREEVADGSVIPSVANNVGIIHKVGASGDTQLFRSNGLKPQSVRRVEGRETPDARSARQGALKPKQHATETGEPHRYDAGLSPGGDFASGIDGMVFTNVGVGIEYLIDPGIDIWVHPKYAYGGDITMIDYDTMDGDRYQNYANFMRKMGSSMGKGMPADVMRGIMGDYPDLDPSARYGQEHRGGWNNPIDDLPSGHPLGQITTTNELNIPEGVPWRDIPAINLRDAKLIRFARRAISEGRGNGVIMQRRDLDEPDDIPKRPMTDADIVKYLREGKKIPNDYMMPDESEFDEKGYQDFLKFLDRVQRENPSMEIYVGATDIDVPGISERVNVPTGFGGKKTAKAKPSGSKQPLGRGTSGAAKAYENVGLGDDTPLGPNGLDIQGQVDKDMPEATIKHARAWQEGMERFMDEQFPTVAAARGTNKKDTSGMSPMDKLMADLDDSPQLDTETRMDMGLSIKPIRELSPQDYDNWKDEFPPWWYRIEFNYDNALAFEEFGNTEPLADIMARLGRYIDMDALPEEFSSLTPEMQLKWLLSLPILGPDSLYGPGSLKAERFFT